jgi:ribonucleotide monophosphatase NagD (HAD superfamily)
MKWIRFYLIVMVNVCFDKKGVIWRGNDLIPGAKEFLAYLRSLKKSILFVSNNSTKSRLEYQEKFKKLGIEAYEVRFFLFILV